MVRRVITRFSPLMAASALAAWALAAPPARPSVPVLRRSLHEILSSGYQLTEPPEVRLREMLGRLLRYVRELLGELSETGPLAGIPEWASPLLTGALIVLLALIVIHIVANLRGLLSERRPGRAREAHPERRRDPRSALQEAEAAFARGELDAAMRLLYLAVLLRLDRLGLLAYDPARTNWENLRALTSVGDEAREAMAELTREIDGCVYAGLRATGQTWDRARAHAERLWGAGEGR
ncbi:MAG: hypothetical protein ACOX9R_01755 [Armatimonadota bacterium]|jgi:hypothetical protein